MREPFVVPSKSGAAELRGLGFAETRRTVTEYQGENHFTFLTAEGQEFAVNHLVNTQFGKGFKIDCSGKVFINDAFIIHSTSPEAPLPVTNIYNINFGVSRNKSEKADFSDNGIDIHVNVEDLLRNALAAHEEIERLRKAGDVAEKVAADTKA